MVHKVIKHLTVVACQQPLVACRNNITIEHPRVSACLQVFNTTPVDLFIFSHDNSAEAVLQKRCPDMAALENVFFMPHDEHWVTPHEVIS